MIRVAYLLLTILVVEPVRANFRLQILHNNDLHSRFVETDEYTAACPKDFVERGKCFGGFARMKKAADQARLEAKGLGIPSIFINAGDSFQGTPYYSFYKWQVVQEMVDILGLDVTSLGNHEFDDGVDNLVEYLKRIKTPVVCANLDLTSEKRLDLPSLTPSTILTIDGVKIGVIGYLTPETSHTAKTENLRILPEIPSIRAEARRLKALGIKIIIALGHSGFDFDMKIASEIEEISVVVGGHSHTLLITPRSLKPSIENATSEYPTMAKQKSGKIVPVVQAYAFCKYLGKLMVVFDDDGNVIEATGNPLLLDNNIPKDQEVENAIAKWTPRVIEQIKAVKGYTRTFLAKPNYNAGQFESNLANLITDAFVDFGVKISRERNETAWTKTPISFYMYGGIRAVIDNKRDNGALTMGDLMTVLPFDNKMYRLKLRGSTIRKALEFSVSTFDSKLDRYTPSYVINFSGLRVRYNLAEPSGKRVTLVEALCAECDTPRYYDLDDNAIYDVITIEFLADGGDKFTMLRDESLNRTLIDPNISDLMTVVDYVVKNQIVYPILDNRVQVIGFQLSSKASSSTSLPIVMTLTMIRFLIN